MFESALNVNLTDPSLSRATRQRVRHIEKVYGLNSAEAFLCTDDFFTSYASVRNVKTMPYKAVFGTRKALCLNRTVCSLLR